MTNRPRNLRLGEALSLWTVAAVLHSSVHKLLLKYRSLTQINVKKRVCIWKWSTHKIRTYIFLIWTSCFEASLVWDSNKNTTFFLEYIYIFLRVSKSMKLFCYPRAPICNLSGLGHPPLSAEASRGHGCTRRLQSFVVSPPRRKHESAVGTIWKQSYMHAILPYSCFVVTADWRDLMHSRCSRDADRHQPTNQSHRMVSICGLCDYRNVKLLKLRCISLFFHLFSCIF